MHCICNFICGLSDVIIKTFSQSVSLSVLSHSSTVATACGRFAAVGFVGMKRYRSVAAETENMLYPEMSVNGVIISLP